MDEITLAKSEIRLRHWQKLIDACQTSGMTVKPWCEANDVSDKSYYYWLKKVRKRALETSGMLVPVPETSPAAIVPLEVTTPAVSGTAAGMTGWHRLSCTTTSRPEDESIRKPAY